MSITADLNQTMALVGGVPLHVAPPAAIGRYRVLRELGSGAMGSVYEAEDPVLGRRVAVKRLRPRMGLDAAAAQRLVREARAVASLSHPNVVEVFEVGHDDGVFVAMAFIDGTTLTDWLAERERDVREILDVFLQAGEGLAAAHELGIVHRDFKPDNVMVGRDGGVKVVDFGLAVDVESLAFSTGRSSAADSGASWDRPVGRLTEVGSVVGTPSYMAPEQHLGEDVGPPSDQYAFCVSLYEALYGTRPFAGPTVRALARHKLDHRIVEPSRARGPRRLRRAVIKGLQRAPGSRWPSMRALLGELERVRRPRRRLGLVGLGIVAVLGGRAAFAAGEDTGPGCPDSEELRAEVLTDEAAAALQARLGPQFDGISDYADRLATMSFEACAAFRSGEALEDRKTTCLRQRRESFVSLVDVMLDEAITDAAVARGLSALPSLEACEEATSTFDRPVPREPALAESVAEARKDVRQAASLYYVGEAARAQETARAAVERARELDYAPLSAEALYRYGDIAARNGDWEVARDALEESVWTASAADYVHVEVAAAAVLIHVEGVTFARYDTGQQWANHAESRLPPSWKGGSTHASIVNARAMVEQRAGHLEAAEKLFRRALELREANPESSPIDLGVALQNHGAILQELGRAEESVQVLQRAVDVYEREFGREHFTVAQALGNLGNALEDLHRYGQARRAFEESIAIVSRTQGAEHPNVLSPLTGLGLLLIEVEDFEAAGEALQRVLELAEAGFGPGHPEVARALNNLGLLELRQNHFEEARTLFLRSSEIRAETLGSEHPTYAEGLTNVALTYLDAGRPAEAEPYLDKALAIFAAVGESASEQRAYVLGLKERALEEAKTKAADTRD